MSCTRYLTPAEPSATAEACHQDRMVQGEVQGSWVQILPLPRASYVALDNYASVSSLVKWGGGGFNTVGHQCEMLLL